MSETVAEIAATAENDEQEDDSMEKLQIEEEDENNISAEDLLGGKSLIMSDSDGEKDVSKDNISKEITEVIVSQVKENYATEDNEEDIPRRIKSRSAVLDSNSEDEDKPKPKKKISAIIDTDSEIDQEENVEKPSNGVVLKKKKKISALIDTDSEEEESLDQPQKEIKEKKRNKKLTKKNKQRLDSDDKEDKLKKLVDSESETDQAGQSNAEESAEDEKEALNVPSEKAKKAKPMRASAKKALDGMQAIQSEQQRLHREAHISVPYHQPKPRTLKEFLSRRTINMPLATAMAGGSPIPNRQPRKSIGLRMTSDELAAYAKLMDERAKEATEFFKSDSETEEDQCDQNAEEPVISADNMNICSEVPEGEPKLDLEADNEEPKETIDQTETMEEESPSTETIISSPSKMCLITEVVELPRLDLSTLNITPPSKPATPRISEAIKRLKMEKSSDISPSLKGDPNMVIDLESGDMFAKKPSGVDDLLQRLIKTREAKKHKTVDTVNILSTDHGKLELSKVNIHLHEDEPVNKEQKPGAAYIKMQEQLKSLITKKRLEDLRKKKAEEMEQAANDDEEYDEMNVDEEYEPEEKEEQHDIEINEDEEIMDQAAEVEDSSEDVAASDVDAEVAEESSSSSSSESEVEPEAVKKKNRIIRPFQGDNSDDEDDLLQTPKANTTLAPMTATQLQLSAHKLFDREVKRTASDEENELLDLCSGQFPQSQMISSKEAPLISQIPITQFPASSQAPDELEGLCSGSFATQQPEEERGVEDDSPPLIETNKILSSDDEPKEELQSQLELPRKKKLTKKRQKKKAKLGFSDDEDSETDEDVDDEEDEMLKEEEVPETFVDYDSEENEVVVEMTKKDRKLRAANFVDKEAELSESEWGSADEDEKNMDTYDMELGDEDEFDREKLRSELEQIHARKMLDQDIREVRKIKEMLIEDEEGAVRQRQFRWKNAESGFSLEEQSNLENGGTNEGSGDEENEHLWRKIRFEREQLLLEKGLKGTETSPSPLSPAFNNTPGSSIRKLNIITAKKKTVETVKKSSPFLITKTVTSIQQKQQSKAVRGSFLVRDKETLTKLAGLTKGPSGTDADGTAGTVSINVSKAKNFVFATLTEEEHENQKRKAADLLNSSSEAGVNFMKKPRMEPRRDKCLIDQLL